MPLMSMIRARQAATVKIPALLLLSARNWEDALYRDELIGYEKLEDGFTVVFALTRKQARRQGDYSRRVDTPMMSEVLARLPEAPRNVFVCGSNAFVNSAADGAVAAGVPVGRIRTDLASETSMPPNFDFHL